MPYNKPASFNKFTMLHPLIFTLLLQFMLTCSPAGIQTDKLVPADTAHTSVQNNIVYAAKDDNPQLENAYDNIPDWYLTNRVQIHTRLSLDDINNADFFGFPEKLAKYHATVLTRQIKFGDEQPWWPSKEGKLNPKAASLNANGQNLAKKIIDQLHGLNMKAIIYYRHLEDAEMYAQHPDWACKDVNGKPIKDRRGVTMSFNSPYRDVVIERLKELASYGADGFYFDEVHIPLRGDFSDYSKAAYKKLYGTDMVSDFKKGNKLRYFEFRNKTIEQLFTDIRASLAQDGKSPVILVSGNSWPTQTDLHMNSEFYQHFILKSEFDIPLKTTLKEGNFKMPDNLKSNVSLFGLNAFCYSLMRDNSYGPPHIWCPRIKTADDAELAAAALISLGCIANLDIDVKTSDPNNFKIPLQWNLEYGKYFKNLSPYAFEGVLVSEKERNAFIKTPDKAWQNVLMPAYLNFQKLYAAGIPLRIVSDGSMTKENIDRLQNIYCNKSLTNVPNRLAAQENKFVDFSAIPNGNEKQMAISLGAPIFAQKENKNIHINYFTDPDGYLYVISARDLIVPVKEGGKITLPVPTREQTKAVSGNYIIYIKQGSISEPQMEDIVNKTTIRSSGTENGYYTFSIKNNGNTPLNMLRFKFKP
ncbi:hypothetical protein FRZ67_15245 [Panacibacter ginsenosidivorans]|uniref:Family 10 glycosylhydrolase n=1 Tax=Panacibacter ginsenosidivorans TaxID=1813871 RepID=A0A5B8VAU2_9BACT|nr:hypothetical protein [Panacibacter ginsenosidivorans]QEC68597.1 hypothetical protein FRZ67_15245 [Panacibacter ginsenosidivorans]